MKNRCEVCNKEFHIKPSWISYKPGNTPSAEADVGTSHLVGSKKEAQR